MIYSKINKIHKNILPKLVAHWETFINFVPLDQLIKPLSKMKNLNEKSANEVWATLEDNGFSSQEFDGDIHQPDNILTNDKGVYIGDFLKENGFTETIETDKKNRTWIMFKGEFCEIGHRDLKEYQTKSWFFNETRLTEEA